ncbi:MAG: tetratricopeptide repeat protein [Gammaproteobacteria bacterium]|nr:tetratricopeptide repeat protein [Gammaproteobacteria bacterium]
MAEKLARKLAVLLHADVAGSTALVRLDETLAHQRIQDAFQRFSEVISTHDGVAHEMRGDALVAEFSRASDAVSAGLSFQAANTTHNEELPDEIRPVIRVGIAMGEVVIADNTVTGEGIVLAQRLEQLAEPGGVCIHDAAYQTVPKRLPFSYEHLGERELRGFDEPVRVYAVRAGLRESEAESPGGTEAEALSRPTRASIAVLAFANMSGDPKQEFFSDGITEDIITELSRFPVLAVIARQSSFSFKGEKIGIKEIGEKLGVQYVVEGSVRRGGNRTRITAQLIEAETGNHIWAERYDRELEDIFAVQDEVTRAIVATVAAQLGKAVSERAARKPTKSIKSYEYFLQANRHYYQFNPDDNVAAAKLYEKAIERDAQFARAYAGLANTYTTDHFLGWQRRENALQNGLEAAQTALKLDSSDALARIILAWALIGHGRWDEAESELDRMLSLKPGDADVLAEAGNALKNVGRVEVGIALLEEAIRLNPLFPESYRRWLGLAYYRARRYQDAALALRAARLEGWAYGCLAASLAQLGEHEQAREALKTFVAERRRELEAAGVSADRTTDLIGNYKDNFRFEEDWEHLLAGLRMAGLTE